MRTPIANCKLLKLLLVSVCASLVNITWGHEGEEKTSEDAISLSADEQKIADFLSDYAQAFASGDIQRIETFFLSDERLSYFEGTFVDRGWASYKKHLADELPVFSETRYAITDIRPGVESDLAFATFSWALDVMVVSDQFEGGKHPVSMRGVGTVVLVRDNDRWQIRHMHTAREQAAAPTTHGAG